MKRENTRTETGHLRPLPRKRFRIDRLEERIAPKKKGASPTDSGGGGKSSIY